MAKKKKPEDQPMDEPEGSDDSFGLPEIEYQPLGSSEEQPSAEAESSPQPDEQASDTPASEEANTQEQSYSSYSSYMQEEKSSVAPKVIGILAVLLLAAAAVWYFAMYAPAQQEKEKARQAQIAADNAKKAAAEKAEQERLKAEQAAAQRTADSLASLPKAGAIETLPARTGRYYVVLTSAVDDDLIMDRAKKLSGDNVSSKIIPPYGKHRFYRLAIADGETFSAAQNTADGLKSTYGETLWVLKY